jgi:hypothetical protein
MGPAASLGLAARSDRRCVRPSQAPGTVESQTSSGDSPHRRRKNFLSRRSRRCGIITGITCSGLAAEVLIQRVDRHCRAGNRCARSILHRAKNAPQRGFGPCAAHADTEQSRKIQHRARQALAGKMTPIRLCNLLRRMIVFALLREKKHAFKMNEQYSMGDNRRVSSMTLLRSDHGYLRGESPSLLSRRYKSYILTKGFIKKL